VTGQNEFVSVGGGGSEDVSVDVNDRVTQSNQSVLSLKFIDWALAAGQRPSVWCQSPRVGHVMTDLALG